MADEVKKIIDTIKKISGRYAPYEVFSDWVKCSAIAICNQCHIIHDKVWEAREKEYIDTMERYDKAEREQFPEIFKCLVDALEESPGDVLGEVFMRGGMGNSGTGQFFTPYHVSKLTARMAITKLEPDEDGVYHVNEPSCGSGGMVIAVAEELKRMGINYQRKMKVIAQDIDWRGVYMAYVQLSLLGIKAIVVQGDTLRDPYRKGYSRGRMLETPGWMGALL